MQTFNIDIAQSPAPLVLYTKQGDSLSRFFQINFLESGQPWTPPAGALFAVRYGTPGLPSGWYDTIQEQDGSSHSAFGLLGNALTVEIAYEAVSVSGRNVLCVLVLDANGYQAKMPPKAHSITACSRPRWPRCWQPPRTPEDTPPKPAAGQRAAPAAAPVRIRTMPNTGLGRQKPRPRRPWAFAPFPAR